MAFPGWELLVGEEESNDLETLARGKNTNPCRFPLPLQAERGQGLSG
jgi:hypothetical protein